MRVVARRAAVAALGLVVIALLAWRLWPRARTTPSRVPASSTRPAPAAATVAEAGSAPRPAPRPAAASSTLDFDAAERAEFNRVKAEGARLAIVGVTLNRDFPFWTRPLDDSNRWRPPQVHRQRQEGPLTRGRELELWPAKPVFQVGDPVLVHARVLDANIPIAVTALEGFTEAQPRLGRPTLTLAFRDDGAGGDEVAADLTYTALAPIDAAMARAQPGGWGYRVRAHVGPEPLETSNQFVLWPDGVTLTGIYDDALEDGSLVIQCGVRADAPTSIQIRGELHGPHGEDIAFGWANTDVPKGDSAVNLVFWGKAIHDRAIDGPYRLENLVLAFPSRKQIGPVAVPLAHTTAAYRADAFRSDGYNVNDPMFGEQLAEYRDLLGKAERGELLPGTE